MITLAQLHMMIKELDEGSFAILDEGDREYVEGVKMLLHMQEPVSEEAKLRITGIYQKFQQTMHLAMQSKE